MQRHLAQLTASGEGNSSVVAVAARANNLGVGFSGSGFLIFYFTGVLAVLKQLGVINNSTRLAGASGGAVTSVLACADVPAQKQLSDLLNMASICRSSQGCSGFLDQQVQASLSALLGPASAQQCSGRLWISLTEAQPGIKPDTNVLLGSNWSTSGQLVAASRASSYLPGLSGRSATLQLPDFPIRSTYDGGYTQILPCPPGVKFCVKVAVEPGGQVTAPTSSDALLQAFNNPANNGSVAALKADPATGPFIPLNPVVLPPPKPDIYPGLSKPLPVNASVWLSYVLDIPDNASLVNIFNIGRHDAAFWASRVGVASAADATKALQATAPAARW